MLVAAGMAITACTAAATPAPTVAPTAPGTTPTTDGTLPKPELSALRFGASIQEPSQFAPKLAEMAGLFEKYGIKASVTTFNADGDALQALLAGQTDMASVGAGGVINSRLTDQPAKTYTQAKIKVIDGLFCQANIKTVDDLKGKAVAVSTLGSTGHASALLALEGLKLTDKDVLITPTGGQAVRIAAMKGGSVACAPVGMDLANDMKGLGFNLLIDLSIANPPLPYPATGLTSTDAFAAKNPNTILVAVAAVLEAQDMMWSDVNRAAKYWAQYAQITEARALEILKLYQDQGQRDLRFPVSSFQFAQKVISIVSPGIMTVDVNQAVDHTYLKKLETIGFYKARNIPILINL
jgi:ABC-type nitrate/sulfonate/bicarbonate transport system substrate-binding protein